MENELIRASENRDYATVKKHLANMNVVDIAEALEEMKEPISLIVFRMLPKDAAAEVFAYLPSDVQQGIVEAISDREINAIVEEMFLDDAVDFIEEMPSNVVKRVLATVPADRRDMINSLLQYPEDSAGSVMTVEYVALKLGCTVREAFAYIRKTGVDKETIYTCYVIDQSRHLMGTVSALTLLLSDLEDKVDDIMDTRVVFTKTTEDKESLTNDFRKYGLLAMPVTDGENRLVGIITVDDVLTVQKEEATEDFQIMAALSPSEEPYLKTSVWKHSANRLPWLLLLMLTATITGSIISGFEDALAKMAILVTFIPMLMDTGGNAGSQSSTLVIRGIALEELAPLDTLRVLWKELRVALLCGGALSIVNFCRILIMDHNSTVALGVSLALYITVVIAKTTGCLLPLIAKRLKLDPAVMASPLITTIVDACALIVYFALSSAIFGI